METKNEIAPHNRLARQIIERVSFQKQKVFIALPMHEAVNPLFFQCCMKLTQELAVLGVHGQMKTHIGDSAIGRARNALTREFLDSDCSHLLFIDSDLVFGGEQIQRIMAHSEPIVGGLYCKKNDGAPGLVLNCLDGGGPPMRPDGLKEVKYIGTGFMRVAREVFERIIERFGEDLRYTPDENGGVTEYDFWKMGVYKYAGGGRRWLSEDWMFAQMAIDAGYKIWADMHILLKHCDGFTTYPLRHQIPMLYPHLRENGVVIEPATNDTTKA